MSEPLVSLFQTYEPGCYVREHALDALLGAQLVPQERTTYERVDPDHKIPYPPELEDLARLHFLITSRKVITVLEFGVGHSTIAMAHALAVNQKQHAEFVDANLRKSNPFEIHSVDDSRTWIDACQTRMPETLKAYSHVYHCPSEVSDFNGRLCTYYHGVPNVCPDLIYLDVPHQFSPQGDLRGLSTRHADRMPMAADILTIEHFLLPGTLIVVDGRTANARFLRANLQRTWTYAHIEAWDQHLFSLDEPPLGALNHRHMQFVGLAS